MKTLEREGSAPTATIRSFQSFEKDPLGNSQQQSIIFVCPLHTPSDTFKVMPLKRFWLFWNVFDIDICATHHTSFASFHLIGICARRIHGICFISFDLCVYMFVSLFFALCFCNPHPDNAPKRWSLFSLQFHYLQFNSTELFLLSGRMFFGDLLISFW